MKTRFITGLVMAIVIIPLIVIKQLVIPFQIVMALAVVIAVLEMLKMFESEVPLSILTKITTLVLTLGFYFSLVWFTSSYSNKQVSGFITPKLGISIFLIVIITLSKLVWDENSKTSDIGKMLTIIFYVGLGAGSITILRMMNLSLIVYLFLTTASTDIFAYLFGSKFGKHKMAPTISPKKSWEGAIAGTIIATLLAGSLLIFYGNNIILDGNKFMIYLLTMLLSVMGQIGDLIASKFKRTYDIKDFGNIFPGHGGILDRFDSAFFASMFLIAVLLLIAA